jgi:hypothetical protein
MNWWHIAVICAGGGMLAEALRTYKAYIPRSPNPRLARVGWDAALTLLIVPPLIAIGFALLSNTTYFAPVAQWVGL